jgi:hypothetical protein
VKTRMFYARNRIAMLLRRFGMHRAFPAAAPACKRQACLARPASRAMQGYIH